MIKISISWSKLPHEVIDYFLFDLKDSIGLDRLEQAMKNYLPGNYILLRWQDVDHNNNIVVGCYDEFTAIKLSEFI